MAPKNHIKGSQGIYCPISISLEQGSPFVEDLENETCPFCQTWRLAEKQTGKSLERPPLDPDHHKGELAYLLDFFLGGKKILLIEDSPVSMKVLTKTLVPLSSILLQAANGEEGLELLVQHPDVGLIMLDMDMPVMDGSTFMESIQNQYGANLPFAVMLVSELSDWQEAKRLIDRGVLAYVKKPFGKKELYRTAIGCMIQFMQRTPLNLS